MFRKLFRSLKPFSHSDCNTPSMVDHCCSPSVMHTEQKWGSIVPCHCVTTDSTNKPRGSESVLPNLFLDNYHRFTTGLWAHSPSCTPAHFLVYYQRQIQCLSTTWLPRASLQIMIKWPREIQWRHYIANARTIFYNISKSNPPWKFASGTTITHS